MLSLLANRTGQEVIEKKKKPNLFGRLKEPFLLYIRGDTIASSVVHGHKPSTLFSHATFASKGWSQGGSSYLKSKVLLPFLRAESYFRATIPSRILFYDPSLFIPHSVGSNFKRAILLRIVEKPIKSASEIDSSPVSPRVMVLNYVNYMFGIYDRSCLVNQLRSLRDCLSQAKVPRVSPGYTQEKTHILTSPGESSVWEGAEENSLQSLN